MLTITPVSPIVASPGPLEEAAFNTPIASAIGQSNELRRRPSVDLCRAAIRLSELRLRLPAGILLAIGQVESGRSDVLTHRLEPWPWTVQALGEGLHLDTKAEAIAWVNEAEARGITSIDVGCLQVSLLFHPHAFATLDEAFDPQRNADYAGRFLNRLHVETGDWRQAIGLYHSRKTTISLPYREKIDRALQGADSLPLTGPPTALERLREAWRSTLPDSDRLQFQSTGAWTARSYQQARPHLVRVGPPKSTQD